MQHTAFSIFSLQQQNLLEYPADFVVMSLKHTSLQIPFLPLIKIVFPAFRRPQGLLGMQLLR